jgi:hypothetical protein
VTAGDEVVGFATVAEADDGMELEDLVVDPDSTWVTVVKCAQRAGPDAPGTTLGSAV